MDSRQEKHPFAVEINNATLATDLNSSIISDNEAAFQTPACGQPHDSDSARDQSRIRCEARARVRRPGLHGCGRLHEPRQLGDLHCGRLAIRLRVALRDTHFQRYGHAIPSGRRATGAREGPPPRPNVSPTVLPGDEFWALGVVPRELGSPSVAVVGLPGLALPHSSTVKETG